MLIDRVKTLKAVSTKNLNFHRFNKNTSKLNSPVSKTKCSKRNSQCLSRASSNMNSSKNLNKSKRTFREKLEIQKKELEECRKSAKDIIDNWESLNSHLQFKMSYFYGPYNGTTRRTPLIPMKFEKSGGKIDSTVDDPPKPWNQIGNLILK